MSYVAFGNAARGRGPELKSLQRLPSGLRITRAADDAAGLTAGARVSPLLESILLPALGPAAFQRRRAPSPAPVVDIASGPVPPTNIGSGPAPPHPAGCSCAINAEWVYMPSSAYAVGGWVCRLYMRPLCR